MKRAEGICEGEGQQQETVTNHTGKRARDTGSRTALLEKGATNEERERLERTLVIDRNWRFWNELMSFHRDKNRQECVVNTWAFVCLCACARMFTHTLHL